MKTSPEPFQYLATTALRESPWNPRKRFAEEALAELAESIRRHGVMAPIIVRPFPGTSGAYEIAAGHRRYRAALRVDLAALPAIVREMTDEQFLDVLTIENLQREDLHPLEEASGYRELMEHAGRDVETIAEKIGKSASYIYQRLKLLDLAEPVREAFWADSMSAGHAILLARLQPKDQVRGLKEITDRREWQRPLSVRDLTEWIEREVHRDLAAAVFPIDDAELVAAAGACTACPKRTKAQPLVFPDAKRDGCLDPGCYSGKATAMKARNLSGNTGALRVSENYCGKKDGQTLSRDRWEPIPAGKTVKPGEAKTAVVMDGPRTGAVIQVRVKPASGAGATGVTAGARKKAEEEQRRRREETERRGTIRAKILDAILARAGSAARTVELHLFATELLRQGGCDGSEFTRGRHGWAWGAKGDEKLRKDLHGMNAAALVRLLLELTLGGYVEVSLYDRDADKLPPALLDAAKNYGVNAQEIERQVLAHAAPKAEPLAKKTAKPKPAPKKAAKPAVKKGKR